MHCPVCSEQVIQAFGDVDSQILLVGSSPSEEEIKYNRPFTGHTIHIWKKELFKLAKIDLTATRQVLVEYHDGIKKSDCAQVSLSLVEKEFENKQIVILVGASAVKTFTGKSIDDVNGLDVTQEVYEFQEEMLATQHPDMIFFAVSSPKSVFKSLGEVRFGLTQLGKVMEKIRNG